ncbi:GTP-binding protein [Actibacterium sp.]|uniref:CobW family GTP-binding protein n=1 Tax=Actibacterium sp. TaxID=1872125 RepID=UPI003566B216
MSTPENLAVLAQPKAEGRVPVTLLTGFLGAGKTTFLNRLMTLPEMASAAVFINEFGEIGIDHHLVERIDEALVILESGCVCCTVQGDLIAELKRLHDRVARREIPPVSRVVIETTGLADPMPVVRALMEDRFASARFRCDGIVTVVDSGHALAQLAHHREARVQVSMADRLVMSKTDLSDRATRHALMQRLAELNPAAPRLEVDDASQSVDKIFGGGLYASEQAPQDLALWLGQAAGIAATPATALTLPTAAHAHSGRVRSFSVRLPQPVAWRGFAVRIGEILGRWQGKILRLKGIVAVDGITAPMAIQCVQSTAYAPVRLARWPSHGAISAGQGAVVVIGEGLSPEDEHEIRALLADLPADALALRRAAAQPDLATRNWLGERMPLATRPGLSSGAFVIQPRFLRDARAGA